jgi:signal transduction histidine kinase
VTIVLRVPAFFGKPMAERMTAHDHRASSFFWQGLFILLPVLLLAVVGFLSIRQDKALVEQQAREQAREMIADLGPRIWQGLTNLPPGVKPPLLLTPESRIFFVIDEHGELTFPEPYNRALVPATPAASHLTASQLQLWSKAESSELRQGDLEDAKMSYEKFLASDPPEPMASRARYNLGLVHLRLGQTNSAREWIEMVATNRQETLAESGLPLGPLAQLQLLQLEPVGSSEWYRRRGLGLSVLNEPSTATPLILKTIEAMESSHTSATDAGPARQNPRPLKLWEEWELARDLYEETRGILIPDTPGDEPLPAFTGSLAAPPRLNSVPRCFWIGERRLWLGVAYASSREKATAIRCLPKSAVHNLIAKHLGAKSGGADYLQLAVNLAGQWIELPNGAVLAESVAGESTESGSLLKVAAFLTDREKLFARQRQRTLWAGALIGVAVISALAGFVAARRAFHRQLHLNELKSNFVSSVSHELRAPIASVRLLAEGLESGRIKEEPKRLEYFKFIVQECRRLSALIENVLDFSRIEQGRKQYEFEETDVAALIQKTIQVMQPYAGERGIRLATSGIAENHSITADAHALQQALVNLIDNAVKHSPAGGVVSVGLERHASFVAIWVEDKGEGIPIEEQERIFQRFYRVGSELRRETQGVGIGLSIVKHIVEAHGGRVTVRSAPGQGSRFVIELPALNAPANAKTKIQNAELKNEA